MKSLTRNLASTLTAILVAAAPDVNAKHTAPASNEEWYRLGPEAA